MQSTGIKKVTVDTMYQNKVEEIFPIVEISAGIVKDLLAKNMNDMFPLNVIARVIGIEDRDTGGDKKEPYYKLEIREAEVGEKPVDAMTPTEVATKIEEAQ